MGACEARRRRARCLTFGVALLHILQLRVSYAQSQPATPLRLDESSWEKEVVHGHHASFVYYHGKHDDSEPHDQILEQLRVLAAKYTGIATVAIVDCGKRVTREALCDRVAAVPKLPYMAVYPAQKQRDPLTRTWIKAHTEYDDTPHARQMSMALQHQLVDDSIYRISNMRDWDNFVDAHNKPKVLIFSTEPEPSVLMRGVAMHYMNRLTFAQVNASITEILDEYHVKHVPAIVLQRQSGDTQLYEGDVNAVAMSDWLRKFAPEKLQDEVTRKNLEDTAPIFEKAPRYRNVSATELDRLLRESEDVWALMFVHESAFANRGASCVQSLQQLVNVTEKVGEMFKLGLVRLVDGDLPALEDIVDVDKIRRNKCFVEVLIKPFGESRTRTDLLSFRDALESKALLAQLYPLLPQYTTHITEDSFAAFMGMHPGGLSPFTPKVILITNKIEAPAFYQLIAANFRKRDMAFGWASEHRDRAVLSSFPVPRVPFLLVAYVDPTTAPDSEGQVPMAFEPFTMPLKYTYIENFLETIAKRIGRGEAQGGDEDDKEEYSGYVRHTTGSVAQLQTDSDMSTTCIEPGSVCVIAMLDARHEQLRSHLSAVSEVQGTRRDQPLQFMWVDAPRQPDFTRLFSISRFPAVVLYSPRKQRFSRVQGAFKRDAISKHIDKFFAAQLATFVLEELPSLVDANSHAEGNVRSDGEHCSAEVGSQGTNRVCNASRSSENVPHKDEL